jgi:hypothetical protein
LLSTVEQFARGLTSREVTILRLGLEASHLEESVVLGDFQRAAAHVQKVSDLLAELGVQ